MILFYGAWSAAKPELALYEADHQRCTLDVPLVDGLVEGGPLCPPDGWEGPQLQGTRKGYLILCMDDDDVETTWYVLVFWDRSANPTRNSIAAFMTDESEKVESEEGFWQTVKATFPEVATRIEEAR